MKIFLVDDDDVINAVHNAVIKVVMPQADIQVFKSGAELFRFVNLTQSDFEPPQFLFIDIRMPEMNGFDVVEALESMAVNPFEKSKIIILSSTLDERDLKTAESHSIVYKFMTKPLNFEVIKNLIGQTNP